MKKILHLTHTDIATDSRILKEIESLVNAGHNVIGIGINRNDGSAKSNNSFFASINSINLKSRSLTFAPRIVRHLISLLELLIKILPQAIRYKPDVIHCHDTTVLLLGVLVKLFTGARLIYDAHELESDRNGLSKLEGKFTLIFERILWRFIDALIVVSPSIQEWYLGKLGPKLSTVILNSPTFKVEKNIDRSYLRTKFSIPPENHIFIYIGILGRGRGLNLLINAFANDKIKSHIVFLGFGELLPSIMELAGSNNKIHVHQAVPHAQVVPVAMSADYGLCLIENVSLSDYLCLPNKLFEYCFAGLPVLASDFPDIKKLVKDYDVGECCSPNLESIIAAIRNIEDNRPNYKFKELKNLSWQKQEENLLQLYDRLFDQH